MRPPAMEVVDLDPKTPAEIGDFIRAELGAGRSDERSREVLEQGRRIAHSLAAQARIEPFRLAVQAVRLGSVTLVAVPAELFLELGESIRAQASGSNGSTVIVIGYANGYLGYLTSRDAPPTYEVLVSPVRLGSGEKVVEAAIKLAREVAEVRSTT